MQNTMVLVFSKSIEIQIGMFDECLIVKINVVTNIMETHICRTKHLYCV